MALHFFLKQYHEYAYIVQSMLLFFGMLNPLIFNHKCLQFHALFSSSMLTREILQQLEMTSQLTKFLLIFPHLTMKIACWLPNIFKLNLQSVSIAANQQYAAD